MDSRGGGGGGGGGEAAHPRASSKRSMAGVVSMHAQQVEKERSERVLNIANLCEKSVRKSGE